MSDDVQRPGVDTPGFRGAVGRKSGRPAPRAPIRMAARERVMASHGLISPGDANPNQGQLFSTEQHTQSLEQMAASRGLPAPLASSRGGWLSGIGDTPTKSAASRKVEAITKFAQTRETTRFPGAETAQEVHPLSPQAHHMRGIQTVLGKSNPNTEWYANYSGGSVTAGNATRDIDAAAARTGTRPAEMSRAVAVTSPQMPWTSGNKLYQTKPNVTVAASVATTVQSQMLTQHLATGKRSFSEGEIQEAGHQAPGQGLALGKGRAALAFAGPGETARPIPATEGYGKVPNFNESLLVGREDIPGHLRAAYAGSYTSDSWDLTSKGLDPETFHQRKGQYEVDKMLSTRTALKNGMLPPHMQETTWEHTRSQGSPEPLTASVESGGRYEQRHSLFREEPFTKRLTPSYEHSPVTGTVRETPKPLRSPIAERLGLDF